MNVPSGTLLEGAGTTGFTVTGNKSKTSSPLRTTRLIVAGLTSLISL
jgi:hypothetical protein